MTLVPDIGDFAMTLGEKLVEHVVGAFLIVDNEMVARWRSRVAVKSANIVLLQ